MKRVILSVLGTVTGLVALLSFKTESHPLGTGTALPQQSLSTSAAAASASSSSAPPTGGSSTAAASTSAAAARQYVGTAVTTRYGVIQVKVTVAGAKITDVGFVQLTAFDHHSEDINSQAAPSLLKETLEAQSAHIDTVSGATYTSDGYLQSLQSALDAAGVR